MTSTAADRAAADAAYTRALPAILKDSQARVAYKAARTSPRPGPAYLVNGRIVNANGTPC